MHALITKRYSDKNSSSSLKFPPIQKILKSEHTSKNKLKIHDISVGSMDTKQKSKKQVLKFSRPSSINQKANRYIKQKSKSRAEPSRFRTQSIADSRKINESLVASSQVQNLDDTLKDFRKYIQQNKEQIHSQIHKRIYINRNSDKNISMFSQNREKRDKRKSKVLTKKQIYTQSEIFDNLQKIINNKNINAGSVDLKQVQHRVRLASITKNIRKTSPDKSLTELRNQITNQQNSRIRKVQLKDENNYHEWRRVNIISPQQAPNYSVSTLQSQNQRLTKLTLKTQTSLSRYLQNRKQLLELKAKSLKTVAEEI